MLALSCLERFYHPDTATQGDGKGCFQTPAGRGSVQSSGGLAGKAELTPEHLHSWVTGQGNPLGQLMASPGLSIWMFLLLPPARLSLQRPHPRPIAEQPCTLQRP